MTETTELQQLQAERDHWRDAAQRAENENNELKRLIADLSLRDFLSGNPESPELNRRIIEALKMSESEFRESLKRGLR